MFDKDSVSEDIWSYQKIIINLGKKLIQFFKLVLESSLKKIVYKAQKLYM